MQTVPGRASLMSGSLLDPGDVMSLQKDNVPAFMEWPDISLSPFTATLWET